MNLNKAIHMSYLSKLVYEDKFTVKKELTQSYSNFEWFDHEGTQGFAVYSPGLHEIIICFRGTEPTAIMDILADLKAWRKPAREAGLVHFGFAQALDRVYDNIISWMDNLTIDDGYKITCTGHSLGAALATICASRLDAHELYTFGSPRVGNKTFVNEMINDQIQHWRFVNNNDVVTKVPFPLIYRHHGELCYINHHGNLRKMTRWQRIKDQWRGRIRALKKGQPFDGVFDHSMDLYHKKLNELDLQS